VYFTLCGQNENRDKKKKENPTKHGSTSLLMGVALPLLGNYTSHQCSLMDQEDRVSWGRKKAWREQVLTVRTSKGVPV